MTGNWLGVPQVGLGGGPVFRAWRGRASRSQSIPASCHAATDCCHTEGAERLPRRVRAPGTRRGRRRLAADKASLPSTGPFREVLLLRCHVRDAAWVAAHGGGEGHGTQYPARLSRRRGQGGAASARAAVGVHDCPSGRVEANAQYLDGR